tara:strand:+ start:528 stop:1073 length:546 start_codon:yes stop_codon:yes gene_type:complete
MENLNVILTSSLIAGIISAFVSYFISIRLKKLDFKNEYYKEILKKRLNAYQYIEAQIAVLKNVVLDEKDNVPYHSIFSYGDVEFFDYQKNLIMAINYNLWIDDKTTNILERINELFYSLNIKINGLSEIEMHKIGKLYYQQISDLRFELENATKEGLYNLHDIRKAFKTKKKNTKREFRQR